MRRTALLLLALCVALTVAATSGAATIKLGWTEHLKRDPVTRLTFRVATLEITPAGWKADVTITNDGSGKVSVGGRQFAVAEFDTKTNFTKPSRVLHATAFLPVPPATLAPGQRWSGTIAGGGRPDARLYVRLVFGPFATSASPTPFTWITDHAHHVFTVTI